MYIILTGFYLLVRRICYTVVNKFLLSFIILLFYLLYIIVLHWVDLLPAQVFSTWLLVARPQWILIPIKLKILNSLGKERWAEWTQEARGDRTLPCSQGSEPTVPPRGWGTFVSCLVWFYCTWDCSIPRWFYLYYSSFIILIIIINWGVVHSTTLIPTYVIIYLSK